MRQGWVVMVVILGLGLATVVTWRFAPPVRQAWQDVTTLVRPSPRLRFVVVGDNHGVNPVYQQIIETIRPGDYAFLLNLADASEHGTAEEFAAVKALEADLPFPVYHTVGSHDIKADPSRRLFVEAFGHGPNTLVRIGDFRLLILDNGDRKAGFSDATLEWLDQQIQTAPDAPYLMAYHRPFGLPLSAVFGDDETAASRLTNAQFLERLQSIRVAQVFTAHLHTYLRYSLNGLPAVVTGGGGDPAQTVLGGPKNNFFHYLVVTLDGQTPQIEVRPVEPAH